MSNPEQPQPNAEPNDELSDAELEAVSGGTLQGLGDAGTTSAELAEQDATGQLQQSITKSTSTTAYSYELLKSIISTSTR